MESLCSLHFFQANMLYYCSHYNSPTSVNFQKFFDHIGTEILDAHENWMTILSSSLEKEELRDLKFNLCYQIYNISQLIGKEWEQNFNNWQGQSGRYRNGMKSVKNRGRVPRSALDPNISPRIRLVGDFNSGSLSYNFNHYVSPQHGLTYMQNRPCTQ